ncbi:putative dynein heavy chain [Diplonema papillatum]|nr:putative dynein heavy chain [Diplonema papillatum]|eukprot:gene11700-18042_t
MDVSNPAALVRRPDGSDGLHFKVCCNACCAELNNPEGVMTSCRHFFCVVCARQLDPRAGSAPSCPKCRAPCKVIRLRNLPQEVREMLTIDIVQFTIATAQSIQWQFMQNLLALQQKRRLLDNVRKQHALVHKKLAQQVQEAAHLDKKIAQLKQYSRGTAGGVGRSAPHLQSARNDTQQTSYSWLPETPRAPQTSAQDGLADSVSLFATHTPRMPGNDMSAPRQNHSFLGTPRGTQQGAQGFLSSAANGLFSANHRPGTTGTTFTNIMNNVGL